MPHRPPCLALKPVGVAKGDTRSLDYESDGIGFLVGYIGVYQDYIGR